MRQSPTTDTPLSPALPRDPDDVRVLILDGQHVFRLGLCDLLRQQGVEVVAEAARLQDAVPSVGRAAPDVVILALDAPDTSAAEAISRVREACPAAGVLVLTLRDDARTVIQAVAAGACGYLLKDAPVEEIVAAVRAARVGESALSPAAATHVVERLHEELASIPAGADATRALLSERELEVLALIVDGLDNGAIAEQLVISPKTAQTHVSHVLEKLGVENRVKAAVYAVRARLVS
jgi:DNA-binding NarL/FixJ family response regulator